MNWISIIWKRLVLTGLLGMFGGGGYFVGHFETERLVLAASEISYSKGKSETEVVLNENFNVEKDDVRRESDAKGFERGLAEAEYQANSDLRQTKLLAEIFDYIDSRRQTSSITLEAGRELQTAIKAAQAGDFDLASRTLKNPASNVNVGACIPTGQAIEIEENKTIDHCESKVEMAFVGFDGTAEQRSIRIRLNGRFDRVEIGERSRLSNDFNCYVTFLRVESFNEIERPIVRFSCDE